MNLLLYMSPIAVVLLLPAVVFMEPNVLDITLSLGKEHKFMGVLLFLNSAAAYGANLTNFLVTKHTSALTLQVCLFLSLVSTTKNYEHLFTSKLKNIIIRTKVYKLLLQPSMAN